MFFPMYVYNQSIVTFIHNCEQDIKTARVKKYPGGQRFEWSKSEDKFEMAAEQILDHEPGPVLQNNDEIA
jgi:hypothetical protein